MLDQAKETDGAALEEAEAALSEAIDAEEEQQRRGLAVGDGHTSSLHPDPWKALRELRMMRAGARGGAALGRTDDALADYDELLRAYPAFGDAHMARAACLARAGRVAPALEVSE